MRCAQILHFTENQRRWKLQTERLLKFHQFFNIPGHAALVAHIYLLSALGAHLSKSWNKRVHVKPFELNSLFSE